MYETLLLWDHLLVENSVRDHFDNWLASDSKSATAILDFLILRSEERLRRRQEKETARKSATKRLRLPGKLVDCSENTRNGTELFIVEVIHLPIPPVQVIHSKNSKS